jgi:alginate O-acetyltransferase complex protein AlgI
MIFNSLTFFLFFAVVWASYRRLQHQGQNRLLLVASYFFYGWWDWRFTLLLLFTSLVDFTVARRIRKATDTRSRKRWVALSMFSNLGVLFFFKYFNFFADSMLTLLNGIGVNADPVVLRVLLPVGISFYTFQSLGYVIDVYSKKLDPITALPDYLLYVAFFPQLVAGPIERATHLIPQIQRRRVVTSDQLSAGVWLILLGLVKKTVIADNMAIIVNHGFAGGDFSAHGFNSLLYVYAFAFQIYGDFSGYSDVARGLCKLMGFDLMINFKAPYLTSNPSDFWRHWHISLSTWIRDYLYIPLGGNRSGPRRTIVNLFLTMTLAGLWHGAGAAYLIWGAYHGILLIAHRIWGQATVWIAVPRSIAILLFFHFTCLGWLIFRCGSLPTEQATAIVSFFQNVIRPTAMSGLWWPVILLGTMSLGFQWKTTWMERFHEWRPSTQLIGITTALVLVTTFGVIDGAQFIYFQF